MNNESSVRVLAHLLEEAEAREAAKHADARVQVLERINELRICEGRSVRVVENVGIAALIDFGDDDGEVVHQLIDPLDLFGELMEAKQ